MSLTFAAPSDNAIPLHLVALDDLTDFLAGQSAFATTWLASSGFKATLGQVVAVPDPASGQVAMAVAGYGAAAGRKRARFHLAKLRGQLPAGTYRLVTAPGVDLPASEYLGWLLEGYRFQTYASADPPKAALVAPAGVDAKRLEIIATGEALTRDLINAPANDMGPDELEAAARAIAQAHGARLSVTRGDDLTRGFPMIEAVGRASPRAPRLIDLHWGEFGPQLTLVGKGVCFDTGGLDIKPASGMELMKKDMGGAATVLGLATMVMRLGLKLRLRVLLPVVENAISGAAMRPKDILRSRKGLSVEVNNTDAEGRLILADALALADETPPDLLISMATLTGAARVAVGPDLAPFFATKTDTAQALMAAGTRVADPLWELPFWEPYESMIEPGIADLDNAPSGGFAGAITAALFLRRFVTATPNYVHFDIYGWQPSAAPGRTKGGAGAGARALLDALPGLLGL